MFCNQCQETLNSKGCTKNGVCGKKGEVADLQDRLIYVLKSISFYNLKARVVGLNEEATDRFVLDGFFATLTNTNFDKKEIESLIKKGFELRDNIKAKLPAEKDLPAVATVTPESIANPDVAVHSTADEDIRSLRELLTYGMKGMAAYAHHAYILGYKDEAIFEFIENGLVSTTDNSLGVDALIGLVLECGQKGVSTLALLDKANTETYGNPEPTAVNIGVRDKPGILISGHDLRDLEQLLEQTKGTGIDVYTHGEMLPANSYPAFKKYDNFAGNYGNAWWKQNEEFEKFNGPILMTTNCIIPPRDSYKNRIYTTGIVGFEGLTHIYEKEDGTKDFTPLIEQAKTSKPPEQLESGTITTGFAHEAALSVADIDHRCRQNRNDQQIYSHGRLRRQAQGKSLLHRLCKSPSRRHSNPDSWLCQIPLQQTGPWQHRRNSESNRCRTVQRLLFACGNSPETCRSLRAQGHKRPACFLQHSLVRTKSRACPACPPEPWGKEHHPWPNTSGLCLSERSQSSGR